MYQYANSCKFILCRHQLYDTNAYANLYFISMVRILDWRPMQMATSAPSKMKLAQYNIRILDFNGEFVGVINYSDFKLRSSWLQCFKAARKFMGCGTILYTRGWWFIVLC
jgi:hypothetical protein